MKDLIELITDYSLGKVQKVLIWLVLVVAVYRAGFPEDRGIIFAIAKALLGDHLALLGAVHSHEANRHWSRNDISPSRRD